MARKLNAQAIANIKRRMLAAPKKLRDAAETELKRSGEKMAADMRRDAPVDEGDLRDSIHVRTIEDDADQVAVRVASNDWKANFVEFGTSASGARASRQNQKFKSVVVMTKAVGAHAATPAQPFFFPNYRRHKRRVKTGLMRALRKTAATLEE